MRIEPGHLHEPRDSGGHILDSDAAAGGGELRQSSPPPHHLLPRLNTKTRQVRTGVET